MFASSAARAGCTPDLSAALSNPPATELSSRDSDPAGHSQPGWHAPVACTQRLLLCPPPPLDCPSSTHPGCTRPCRQRQPAAPSHEHCGAPRVCNAECRPRAA
ncbi:hypothetical protein NN561_009049 [Cricetulus griseus]